MYKKKKFDSQIFLFYLAWYGFGRMFIEGLRTDSLYWGTIRISQLIGFLTFVAGTILLIILGIRSKNRKKMEESLNEAAALSGSENNAPAIETTDAVKESSEINENDNEPESVNRVLPEDEVITEKQDPDGTNDSDVSDDDTLIENTREDEQVADDGSTDVPEDDNPRAQKSSDPSDRSSLTPGEADSEERKDG